MSRFIFLLLLGAVLSVSQVSFARSGACDYDVTKTDNGWWKCRMSVLEDWTTGRKVQMSAEQKTGYTTLLTFTFINVAEQGSDEVRLCRQAARSNDCHVNIRLSNGETFFIERALLTDARKEEFRDLDVMGMLRVTFSCSETYNSKMRGMNEAESNYYFTMQLAKYDITTVTINDISFHFDRPGNFYSAATLGAMFETLSRKTGDDYLYGQDDASSDNGSVSRQGRYADQIRTYQYYEREWAGEDGLNFCNEIVTHNFGGRGKVVAYFYHKDGTKLQDHNGEYCTADGYVMADNEYTSLYEESCTSTPNVFIPYSELHLGSGHHSLKMLLIVQDDNGKTLGKGDWYYFDVDIN